jgi:uncharacterized protein (TIGR02266 family)
VSGPPAGEPISDSVRIGANTAVDRLRHFSGSDIRPIRGYGHLVTAKDGSKEATETGNELERRSAERVDVTWSVDCETDDTFLYASIANISELGIFVMTREPLDVGTVLTLRFAPPGHPAFVLRGVVQWVNTVRALSVSPNPGMGVRFIDLTNDDRARLVEAIRTIAFVPYSTSN